MSEALKLLQNNGDRKASFLSNIWAPLSCSIFGFGAMCFVNFGTRRPILSGIQKHLIAASLGAVAGKTLDGWRNDHLAERDAVLRHYVELHPDDFPDQERKKYSEVLLKWTPVR